MSDLDTTSDATIQDRGRIFAQNCIQMGHIPLTWARSSEETLYANLGDALSPLIISALAGLPVSHCDFDANCERLVSVGSIGHNIKNGTAHLWGCGMNAWSNPGDPTSEPYRLPPDTEIIAHAVRGPQSGAALRQAGALVNNIWGDPVWFMPEFHPANGEKKWDLGVILHLSELNMRAPDAAPKSPFFRYLIPSDYRARIHLINMWCEPDAASLRARLDEILSCKRILSTSLHGLVLAETYQIPCLYFHYGTEPHGPAEIDISIPGQVDHRFRDFYLGIGRNSIQAYGLERHLKTNWQSCIDSIDHLWQPKTWNTSAFRAAFPFSAADEVVKRDLWQHFP